METTTVGQSMRQVPELSMLSYVEGSETDKVKFIDGLFQGLKDYGFIILKDHIIDQAKVDRAYEYVHEFFQLPQDTKLKYYDKKIAGQRGLTPFGMEHAKDNPNPDLKEFWHVGRDIKGPVPYPQLLPNVWPAEVPEFKPAMLALYEELDREELRSHQKDKQKQRHASGHVEVREDLDPLLQSGGGRSHESDSDHDQNPRIPIGIRKV